MTIQESVYYKVFSVNSLLKYIVSVTFTKFLYMDMTIALKALNKKQQTASIRYSLSNVLIFNAVLSFDNRLPK